MSRSDPLAGQRQAINEGARTSLTWPDRGKGCPVAVHQLLELRTCHIEISRVQRIRRGSGWLWKAEFSRYPKHGDRVHILARGAGNGHGYVHSPTASAMTAQDQGAFTIASVEPMDNPGNLGPPPEPESVPPSEVGSFTGDALARRRYEHELEQAHLAHLGAPLEVRLATLRSVAGAAHVDISADERVIERRLTSMERAVLRSVRPGEDNAA